MNIKRISKKLSIDEKLISSLIKQEDKRFFIHKGLDYKRIFKAIFVNIRYLGIKEGASTITQQLYDIKQQNISLSYQRKRSFKRKIKQIVFAKIIENKMSKEEILIDYLKNVYLGKNIFGFHYACKYYFCKDCKNLTSKEIAYLLERIKRPNVTKHRRQ